MVACFIASSVNHKGKGQSPEIRGELGREGGKQPVFGRNQVQPWPVTWAFLTPSLKFSGPFSSGANQVVQTCLDDTLIY